MTNLTPAERRQIAMLRLYAAECRVQAARFDVAVAAIGAGASLRELATVIQAEVDADVAAHPDLAELNVQFDSFYGVIG